MKSTKQAIIAFGGASLAALVFAATVAAAGPNGHGTVQGQPQAPTTSQAAQAGAGTGYGYGAREVAADPAPTILRLSREEIAALRRSGLSLAAIAEKQGVDPQKLVDAYVSRWSARIDDRVATGALTATEATDLKSQLAARARDLTYKTTLGGMRGVAVGAGPAAQGGRMGHHGAGACDGSGPNGNVQP